MPVSELFHEIFKVLGCPRTAAAASTGADLIWPNGFESETHQCHSASRHQLKPVLINDKWVIFFVVPTLEKLITPTNHYLVS